MTAKASQFVQLITATVCSLAMIITCTFFRFVVTSGPSMEPTYNENDALLCMRRISNLKVGDAVLIWKDSMLVVKRIAFIAGQNAQILNGDLFEVYAYWGSNVVPEGYVFVTGDNLNDSMDSRDPAFGLVSIEEEVWGTVIWHISR